MYKFARWFANRTDICMTSIHCYIVIYFDCFLGAMCTTPKTNGCIKQILIG